jgi:poly-gamma-glutamate capsule biosynthesis protein CapA/YwtB (metallophosphatase superfamily)
MLGRLVQESLVRGDYARPWGDLLPVLRAADLCLVNLECALTVRTERWSDASYKPFYFRADPAAVATLKAGRVDFVSLANNDIGDLGTEGLRDTLAALNGADIALAGAGVDRWSAREPALLTVGGIRVSVVAGADYSAEWAATPNGAGHQLRPGVARARALQGGGGGPGDRPRAGGPRRVLDPLGVRTCGTGPRPNSVPSPTP